MDIGVWQHICAQHFRASPEWPHEAEKVVQTPELVQLLPRPAVKLLFELPWAGLRSAKEELDRRVAATPDRPALRDLGCVGPRHPRLKPRAVQIPLLRSEERL
jgi:hypothetical protein